MYEVSIRGAVGGLDVDLRFLHLGRGACERGQKRDRAGAEAQRSKLSPRQPGRPELVLDHVLERVFVAHGPSPRLGVRSRSGGIWWSSIRSLDRCKRMLDATYPSAPSS